MKLRNQFLRRRLSIEALQDRRMLSVNVLTFHNDNTRDGANLAETTLTPGNVNAQQFGLLGQNATDGKVFAQPLYMSNLSIPGQGTRNVLFVATEHDSVYAFDADRPGTVLWQTSFLKPGVTTIPSTDLNFNLISPEVGITGTPVIDAALGRMFVDATSKETTGGTTKYVHRLHVLDVTTGADLSWGGTVVTASIRGTGIDSAFGWVTFNPRQELNRSALAIANGNVYLAYASYGDQDPFHGWMFAYNEQSLRLVGLYNDTANGTQGGIWMSADGPAIDAAGNLFVSTGNGTTDANHDLADAIVKLDLYLTMKDAFVPYNQADLNRTDSDLSSGGLILLPNPSGGEPRVLAGSKRGTIYLADGNNLGQYHTTYDAVLQELNGQVGKLFSVPAYYNNQVYYFAANDVLKAFSYVNGRLSSTPVAQGTAVYGFPGATPSVSANGLDPSSGIVWTIEQTATQAAVLHANSAQNVSQELYNSTQAGARDKIGLFDVFTTPTVANGHVYVANAQGVAVFGLLPIHVGGINTAAAQSYAAPQTAQSYAPLQTATAHATAAAGQVTSSSELKPAVSTAPPFAPASASSTLRSVSRAARSGAHEQLTATIRLDD